MDRVYKHNLGKGKLVKNRIFVLTPTPLHSSMEDMSRLAPNGCEVKVVDYKDFNNLIEIYLLLEEQADGFITSGPVAQQVIEKVVKTPQKPIVQLGINLLGLYRLLLRQITQNKGIGIDRIILDSLIPIREDISCTALLDEEQLVAIGKDIREWVERSTLHEIDDFQREAAGRLIDLWGNRKFDLVITTFGNTITVLQEHGIPYVYAYPNPESIRDTFDDLFSAINLNQMRENMPVAISISQKNWKNANDLEVNSVSLHKCLLDFNGENLTDFIIQKQSNGFDIFTHLRVAKRITQSFHNCQLSQYFSEHLDFEVCIGYGVGNNLAQAKANAATALQEAAQSGCGSFVIDEKGNLTGPLNDESFLAVTTEVTPEILMAADQAKLSVLTIQKVASILKLLGTDQLTTQDLAAKYGGTVRNAQRILGNLEKSGFAQILYTKASTTKGRPVKIYQISLPDKIVVDS